MGETQNTNPVLYPLNENKECTGRYYAFHNIIIESNFSTHNNFKTRFLKMFYLFMNPYSIIRLIVK